jgi:hypothetical protein
MVFIEFKKFKFSLKFLLYNLRPVNMADFEIFYNNDLNYTYDEVFITRLLRVVVTL